MTDNNIMMSSTMDIYIVNEALCVLANNFGKIPRANIAMIFTEFYTTDEITDAKKLLF